MGKVADYNCRLDIPETILEYVYNEDFIVKTKFTLKNYKD